MHDDMCKKISMDVSGGGFLSVCATNKFYWYPYKMENLEHVERNYDDGNCMSVDILPPLYSILARLDLKSSIW